MSKIEVRPIERVTWHGKKGKESFKRPVTIMALVNAKTGKYDTGLDYSEPFKTPDNHDALTEAEYYGKLIGQDLSNAYIPGKPHPYWDNPISAVKLENRTMIFDTDNPIDYIKVKIMKASKYVANSMREYNEGKYPAATHVISDEQEEVEIKAAKVEIKRTATIEASKLSKERKIQLIHIVGGKNLRGKSDDFIEVEMDNLIENNAKDLLYWIKADKKLVKIKSEVLEAMKKNIIRSIGGKLKYREIDLGFDDDEAADFLSQDINNELLIRVEQEIGK